MENDGDDDDDERGDRVRPVPAKRGSVDVTPEMM